MATAKATRKNSPIDASKLKRAQKLLGTQTEAETIERALDEVIAERERDRRAWRATERLLKSGIQIEDVFGRLRD